MAVPEENILHARDSSIEDSDDWPLYTLRKARVLSKRTGGPVSLLSAHNDHPVTVLGTLEAVNSDLIHSSEGTSPMPKISTELMWCSQG